MAEDGKSANDTLDYQIPEEQAPSLETEANNQDSNPIAASEEDSPKEEVFNPQKRIKEHFDVINNKLKEKELLKLKLIEHNVNLAYYKSWSTDANRTFRRVVLLKKRMKNWHLKTENLR